MSLTVKAIKKICKEKGIKGYSKMKKVELKEKCLSAEQKIKTMTIPELKKMCKRNGIKGYSKMKKAELIKHCIVKKAVSIVTKHVGLKSPAKLVTKTAPTPKAESLKVTRYVGLKSPAKLAIMTPVQKKQKVKKMTVTELKKICKQKGIKGYSKMTRMQLEKACLKSSESPTISPIVADLKKLDGPIGKVFLDFIAANIRISYGKKKQNMSIFEVNMKAPGIKEFLPNLKMAKTSLGKLSKNDLDYVAYLLSLYSAGSDKIEFIAGKIDKNIQPEMLVDTRLPKNIPKGDVPFKDFDKFVTVITSFADVDLMIDIAKEANDTEKVEEYQREIDYIKKDLKKELASVKKIPKSNYKMFHIDDFLRRHNLI